MKTKPQILLIDDDHIFCVVIQDILERAGYSVTIVTNGLKGIQILMDNPTLFDLIILDRVMPELSGLEVLGKLCRLPHIREIPVILLTGRAGSKHVETAVIHGVFEVLRKPPNETQLLKTVEKALREKSETSAAFEI